MLDAHQLNIFYVAAQTLNFSEAARRLHMTQPSVSQHIQSLEQRLGVLLFHRSGRHLSLTEAGEALLPLAREMVMQSIQIEETMASLHGDVYGHLHFGCSTNAGKYILPKLLAGFRKQYPNVKITCHVKDSQTALEMLMEGEVHIALSHERLTVRDVEFRKFMDDPVYLIVPPYHSWAERGEIEPLDLLEGEFIMREEHSGIRQVVFHALPEVGLSEDQLQIIMILENSEAIGLAVAEGIGVSFLSRLVVEALIKRGELMRVRVKGLELLQEIWIGRNLNQAATQAQIAFWEFVHDPNNELVLELLPENDVYTMDKEATYEGGIPS
ncbi:MAG: LysR family transcriptional regulator [Anaerolineales bacterium]|nr:LysR family transcriptional regulator [Anaerolineales bacterium]